MKDAMHYNEHSARARKVIVERYVERTDSAIAEVARYLRESEQEKSRETFSPPKTRRRTRTSAIRGGLSFGE